MNSFSKGISPKLTVIARLEFELTYYDIIAKHLSTYTVESTLLAFLLWEK